MLLTAIHEVMNYNKFFVPFPVFKGESITLRPLRKKDAIDLYDFCKRPESCEFAQWSPHKSIVDTKDFLWWVIKGYRKGYSTVFAIAENTSGRVIGTCSFVSIDEEYKVGEIGYCISSDYWGRGYATAAATFLIEYGFETIGFQRIEARTMIGNVRSMSVLQKLGMVKEAVMKKAVFCNEKSHDVIMWAITDDEYYKGDK
ncbi:MAG: GNAT family N-acetyltransferase [Oscillospiraceae bacterium]